MNVHLTPRLEQLIEAKVKSGSYNSASEVIRQALRLLLKEELQNHGQLENTKQEAKQ